MQTRVVRLLRRPGPLRATANLLVAQAKQVRFMAEEAES